MAPKRTEKLADRDERLQAADYLEADTIELTAYRF